MHSSCIGQAVRWLRVSQKALTTLEFPQLQRYHNLLPEEGFAANPTLVIARTRVRQNVALEMLRTPKALVADLA